MKKISDKVLDDLVRKYIRLLARGYCKRCKQFGYIEVAHMYKRGRKTVRWDLRNVYPLCVDCHQLVDNDMIEKTSFMYELLSPKEISELQLIANMTLKTYPVDREQIKKDLKEKIKELE